MGTSRIVLNVENALPLPTVTLPEFKSAGANFTVNSYSFDAASTEGLQFTIPFTPGFGSGNITVNILWYADTATAGNVVWGASMLAITPDTDSTDVETDTFAIESTGHDTHLGTTAQRIHKFPLTLTGTDSLATADYVAFRLFRSGAFGGDTMAGDAQLVGLYLEYSDT